MRILLVDDNESVRHNIRALLSSRAEWPICGEAADGVDAVAKAKQLRPHVILMDISMPRMDGLEATRVIRQELPETKVILVSQNDPAVLHEQANAVRAAGWVAKSRLVQDLLPALKKAVASARRAQARADGGRHLSSGNKVAGRTQDRVRTPGPLARARREADITARQRSENLLLEQKKLLELIATGCSLDECLNALTRAVKRLQPAARAAVLIADDAGSRMDRAFAADLPASLGEGIHGAPINDLLIATCNTAIYRGEPVTCADIAYDERWSKDWRELCVAHGIRACHSTPVFSAGQRAIGSFVICFGEAREPDEWERSIGQFGAHLASVAIERDRAEQALREDLDLSKALRTLGAQMVLEGDVQILYERIMDAATRITRADYASMQMLFPERGEKGELRLLACRGFDPQAAKFWEWVRADSASSCGAALRSRNRVIVPDIEDCEFMQGTEDRAVSLQTGIHAVQSTPLISRSGRLLGMISTHWRERHQPSERELGYLDLLARQAADFLEHEQTEQALREKHAQAAAELARFREMIDAMPAAIYTTDAEGWLTHFNPAAVEFAGRMPELGKDRWCVSWKILKPDGAPLPHDKCPMAVALKEGQAPAATECMAERPDGGRRWFIPHPTPLRDSQGRIVGGVNMLVDITDRKTGEQSLRASEQRYRRLAESLEVQVRERTRDLEERNADIVAQSEQVRELSARLLRAQDEERKRIARELHDSAGQTLTGLAMEQARIAMQLKADAPDLAKEMEGVQNLVAQLTREIRTASYLLHPPLLDECGLSGALRLYVEGLRERSGLAIDLQIGDDFGRLPADTELSIFRIAQECLTNIHRHSASKDAAIRLSRSQYRVLLEIEDHGNGISPERLAEIQSHGAGVGVRGMRERLRQLDGEMTIQSSRSGTKISVHLPALALPPEDDALALAGSARVG
ncbi:MAG: GAF domain-containing protein [Terriglobia bacterium]